MLHQPFHNFKTWFDSWRVSKNRIMQWRLSLLPPNVGTSTFDSLRIMFCVTWQRRLRLPPTSSSFWRISRFPIFAAIWTAVICFYIKKIPVFPYPNSIPTTTREGGGGWRERGREGKREGKKERTLKVLIPCLVHLVYYHCSAVMWQCHYKLHILKIQQVQHNEEECIHPVRDMHVIPVHISSSQWFANLVQTASPVHCLAGQVCSYFPAG